VVSSTCTPPHCSHITLKLHPQADSTHQAVKDIHYLISADLTVWNVLSSCAAPLPPPRPSTFHTPQPTHPPMYPQPLKVSSAG
jgi:hypothetical protein